MKYWSEILNKKFDSIKELTAAEIEYKKQEEAKKAKTSEKECCCSKETAVSVEKKELAKKVDNATEALNLAYENYEAAKKEAKEILDKAREEAMAKLTPAKEAVNDAQGKRLKAIADFNSKYGVYTTTLTGEKALQEIRRFDSQMADIFNRVRSFNNFWSMF